MNRYELIYIIDTALEETERKELIEKFSGLIVSNGGEIEKIDETWGKRRLAYVINYKTEGYYVLVTFKAGSELPREIERNLQISDSVLRYLVVKLEEKKHSVKPRPVRAVPMAAAPAHVAEQAPQENGDAAQAEKAAIETPVVETLEIESPEIESPVEEPQAQIEVQVEAE